MAKTQAEKDEAKAVKQKKMRDAYVPPETNPLWALRQSMEVKLTFTHSLLATLAGDAETYAKWQASQAPSTAIEAREIALHTAAIKARLEKAQAELAEEKFTEEELADAEPKPVTMFGRNERGELCIRDYYIRGFLKGATSAFIELGIAPPTLNNFNYKSAVDRFLHVEQFNTPLLGPDGKPHMQPARMNSRPQRVDTQKGPRVCLACSEELDPGTTAQFTISWLEAPKSKQAIWSKVLVGYLLDFGSVVGCGQWRSGGHGRFTWKEVPAVTA